MIPQKITLKDFLSYGEAAVDFSGCHLVALSGENGAGKSALAVDALTWALWGKARARSDDDVVRQGADEAQVAVEFGAGGSFYRVTRRRRLPRDGRAGVSALAFERLDGEVPHNLTCETMRETQEMIDSIVGMDYQIFSNTACLIQGRADLFSLAAPGERKAILTSLLGIDQWQAWAAIAHERAREIQNQVEGMDAALVEAHRLLEDGARVRDELQYAEERVATDSETLGAARDALQEAQTLEQAQRGLYGDIERLQKYLATIAGLLPQQERELASLEQQFADCPTEAAVEILREEYEMLKEMAAPLAELEATERARAGLVQQIASYENVIAGKANHMADLERQLISLPIEPTDLKECPTCGQPVKDEAHFRMVEKLSGDRLIIETAIKHAQDEITAVRQKVDQANGDLEALGEQWPDKLAIARQATADLPVKGTALARAEEAVRQVAGITSTIEERRVNIQRLQADRRETQEKLTGAKIELEQIGDMREREAECQDRVRRAESLLEEARSLRDKLKGRLDQLAVIDLNARSTEKERAAAVEKASVYGDVELAMGPRGVQAILIDSAIPHIRDEANRLLAMMSSGTTIDLVTQRIGKTTAREIETLDILIADQQGTRPYENYSGGERFRIDFALRVALSRLLARRAKAPCRVLIMDEGFGSQDSAGQSGLVEALATVKDQFGLILVISHVDEMREIFPTMIRIEKTTTGSRVSLS